MRPCPGTSAREIQRGECGKEARTCRNSRFSSPAHDETLLEASLVSVLQNRPADCEIVVVHDESYHDPYDLAGEVRFVSTSRSSQELAQMNLGIAHCRGSIINVLRCGARGDRWLATGALAHFTDPCLAAVAPLVLARDGQYVASAGVAYHTGGKRVECRRAQSAQTVPGAAEIVLGPALEAAFYRAGALQLLREAYCPSLGTEYADVDLALLACRAGYRARL